MQNIKQKEWDVLKQNQADLKADIEGIMENIERIHGKIEEYEVNTLRRIDDINQKILQYTNTIQSNLSDMRKRDELGDRKREQDEMVARDRLNKDLEAINMKIGELTTVYKMGIENEGRREEEKIKILNENLKSINEKIATLTSIYRKSIEEIVKREETMIKGLEEKIGSLGLSIKKLSDRYEDINKLPNSIIDKRSGDKKADSKPITTDTVPKKK
ncbi:MAG: hypothetical protein HY999_03355 [Nitrospinae bacterium]|nr:hypothetical protein [Nitrospinota bacterium]